MSVFGWIGRAPRLCKFFIRPCSSIHSFAKSGKEAPRVISAGSCFEQHDDNTLAPSVCTDQEYNKYMPS